jgi:hypothetical protein
MNKKKSGQIQIAFNWIYILIAGGVILLFFVGIVVKQKAVSEEQLGSDIVNMIESIFVAASVSENTKNILPTHGLAKSTIYFECSDQVGRYGIQGKSASAEDSIKPLFAPREIKTSQIITWSKPLTLPFKVVDLLFVTSSNTKYFVVGDGIEVTQFVKDTDGLNIEQKNNLEDIDPGSNFQIRIVDLSGSYVRIGQQLNLARSFNKDKVTAISLKQVSGIKTVSYFKLDQDGRWQQLGESIPIISLDEELGSATYAAVFSEDGDIYTCNMKKAFKKLKFLTNIYSGKAEEIETYYQNEARDLPQSRECREIIRGYNPDVLTTLGYIKEGIDLCNFQYSSCGNLLQPANDLMLLNKQLENCIQLY